MMEVVTPTRTFLIQFDIPGQLEDWVEAFKALISSVKPLDPSQQMVGVVHWLTMCRCTWYNRCYGFMYTNFL